MNCPACSQPIGEHVTDYGDMACAACGLAGPRDVLEGLAARLAPADPAKIGLLRDFLLYAERAAHKLAVSYLRREVQPAAEYEWFMKAAGIAWRDGSYFERAEDAVDMRELLAEVAKGGSHG